MLDILKQVFGYQWDTNMIQLQFKWILFIPIMMWITYIHWRALKSFCMWMYKKG